MGKIIKSVVISLQIVLLFPFSVRAEKEIELKIPDEIKLCCDCENCQCKKEQQEAEKMELESSEYEALQKIAIAEAGNTDAVTMAYVMQTVLNRVNSEQFPDSVQSVVKQKGQFSTYPSKYNKAVPNSKSEEAFLIIQLLENREQLYFENYIEGSWQSTHLNHIFDYNGLSFYK